MGFSYNVPARPPCLLFQAFAVSGLLPTKQLKQTIETVYSKSQPWAFGELNHRRLRCWTCWTLTPLCPCPNRPSLQLHHLPPSPRWLGRPILLAVPSASAAAMEATSADFSPAPAVCMGVVDRSSAKGAVTVSRPTLAVIGHVEAGEERCARDAASSESVG